MYTIETFVNKPFNFDPGSAQLTEMIEVIEKVGDPHAIFCNSFRYLCDKYQVRVADIAGHYKYIHMNLKSIYNVKNKARRGISSVYACLLLNFFNEKYNAGLTLSDMYTDLEQRDAFNNLTNK